MAVRSGLKQMKRIVLMLTAIGCLVNSEVFAASSKNPPPEKTAFRIAVVSATGKQELRLSPDNMVLDAFFRTLTEQCLEAGKALPETAQWIQAGAIPEDRNAPLFDEKPDLILVFSIDALIFLSHFEIGNIPVVTMTPDCASAFLPPENQITTGLFASPAFWENRIQRFGEAAGFRRPGYILTPLTHSPGGHYLGRMVLAAGEKWQTDPDTQFFSREPVGNMDPDTCREVVDDLFFDDIDAMILDGNPCFDPGRPDFGELMVLLHQRGILPVSIADPGLSGKGILLGVDETDMARRGHVLACAAFQMIMAENRTMPAGWGGTQQVSFFLDLNVAVKMGFDPPVWLLSIVGTLDGK